MSFMIAVMGEAKNINVAGDLRNLLKDAIVAGAVRGDNATGILQIDDTTGAVSFYKDRKDPTAFFRDTKAMSYIKNLSSSYLTIAVCSLERPDKPRLNQYGPLMVSRQVTDPEGKKSWGSLYGVLEGTPLIKDVEGFAKPDEILMGIFAHNTNFLQKLQGEYGLWWWDDDSLSLRVACSAVRTAYLFKVKDEEVYILANDRSLIKWVAQLNSVDFEGEPKTLPHNAVTDISSVDFTHKVSYYIPHQQASSVVNYGKASQTTPVNLMPIKPPLELEKKPEPPAVVVPPPQKPVISKEERDVASSMKLLGTAVKFKLKKINEKEKLAKGTATFMAKGVEGEFEATIRNLDWDNLNVIWDETSEEPLCTVVGCELTETKNGAHKVSGLLLSTPFFYGAKETLLTVGDEKVVVH